MAYGEGGKSTGYNTEVAGTGGYAKITKYPTTEFPDYDYVIEYNTYYAIKN